MPDATWKGKPRTLAKLIRDLPLYLTGQLQDPTGIMDKMRIRMAKAALGVIYRAYVEKSKGEKDKAGIEWPELSPVTIERRQQRKQAVKARGGSSVIEFEILIDTGRLLRSFSEDGSSDQILEVTKDGVRAGSALEYSEKHQEGTPDVPQRKIIPDWDDWPEDWKQPVLAEMAWGCSEFLEAMSYQSYDAS